MIAKIRFIAKIFRRLFTGYWKKLAFLTALGFLGGILSGLSIGMLVPLISFVVNKGEVGSDFISRAVVKVLGLAGAEPGIITLFALILILVLGKSLVMFVFGYFSARWSAEYENHIRKRLYLSTMEAGWPWLLRQKIGHLENILIIHVRYVKRLWSSVGASIMNFSNFLVYLALALRLSPLITITSLGVGAGIFVLSRPLVRRTARYSKDQAFLHQDIAHSVNENMLGMKTIKAMGAEQALARSDIKFFKKYRENQVKSHIASSLGSVFIEPIAAVFLGAVFLIFYRGPNFEVGILAAVIYLVQRIFGYMQSAQGSLHKTAAIMQYVNNYLSYEDEASRHREEEGGSAPFVFRDLFEFREVGFSYNGVRTASLEEVTFKIRKGEMAGIVGPSGAGKTTVADLLLRLFEPTKGEILLDGKPAASISLKDWRRNIGYVSQDLFMKNDTIFNNIQFYDSSITPEVVETAAKRAYIYDFIRSLPEGFNTVIGDRGIMLSGGERQRIVLARVFARNPEILLLDEATSSLDGESEAMIKLVLQDIRGRVTTIVIAHRIGMVRDADRILVFDEGRLVEEGKPDDLFSRSDSYLSKIRDLSAVS